eukprot:3501220-Prymnesium_polylepis.1
MKRRGATGRRMPCLESVSCATSEARASTFWYFSESHATRTPYRPPKTPIRGTELSETRVRIGDERTMSASPTAIVIRLCIPSPNDRVSVSCSW